MSTGRHVIEGTVAESLTEIVSDHLSRDGFVDLQWSEHMPTEEPDADLIVVDRSGQSYVLEVDVTLTPFTPPPAPAAGS